MKKVLTHERLCELFSYDPTTGLFSRLVKKGRHQIGVIDAKLNSKGYMRIAIDGRSYLIHRLAWLFVHGSFPEALIDHINGIKTDNRIINLRPCTYIENSQNVSGNARCKSGLRGAYAKSGGRWEAKICVNYKTISLGHFRTAEDAHQAYLQGKKKYHTFSPIFRE